MWSCPDPSKIHKATVVPPVSPSRARTLAPTLKSELRQRRAGVVIGNPAPLEAARITPSSVEQNVRRPLWLGVTGDAVTKYWVPSSERVKAKIYPFLPGKLPATANRLSIRQAVAGVLEHGESHPETADRERI